MKNVKIVVFVPTTHTQKVLEAIGKSGGGVIGNYSYCSFSSEGIGRFKPNEKASPFIGKSGELEEVKEVKIEFIYPKNKRFNGGNNNYSFQGRANKYYKGFFGWNWGEGQGI